MVTKNDDKTLAYRLVLARKQAGLTQEQVAKLLNIHRPTVSEIEAGRRKVTSSELIKFAEIYGVSADWLLTKAEGKFNPRNEQIELAARELGKLKKEDLEKVINLLSTLKGN
jgi:transcriptional regulator with XRE-family HTH domain